jgi:hypothetical protein
MAVRIAPVDAVRKKDFVNRGIFVLHGAFMNDSPHYGNYITLYSYSGNIGSKGVRPWFQERLRSFVPAAMRHSHPPRQTIFNLKQLAHGGIFST